MIKEDAFKQHENVIKNTKKLQKLQITENSGKIKNYVSFKLLRRLQSPSGWIR